MFMIHQSSHFVPNDASKDYSFGESDAKMVAASNPGEAVMNADSYEVSNSRCRVPSNTGSQQM